VKTGAFAIEELKDIEVLEATDGKGEIARLRCRSATGGGRIVLRLEGEGS
jgi:ribosomal protein S28E/S33